MSMMNKMQSTEISPKAVLFSIVGLLVVSGAAITFIVRMVSGTPAEAPPAQSLRPAARISTPALRGKAAAKPVSADAYQIIVTRNLFRTAAPKGGTPAPPADQPPVVITTKTPTGPAPVAPFAPVAVTPTAAPIPRPRLVYSGLVEIGEQPYALLENLDLNLAQYSRVSSNVFGWTLVDISPRAVTLQQAGDTFTLAYGIGKPDPVPTPEPPKREESRPQQPAAAATANPQPPTPAAQTDDSNNQRQWRTRRTPREG